MKYDIIVRRVRFMTWEWSLYRHIREASHPVCTGTSWTRWGAKIQAEGEALVQEREPRQPRVYRYAFDTGEEEDKMPRQGTDW